MKRLLLGLNIFMGICACFGAYFAFSIKEGTELMGLTTDVLKNSPFQTFLIPGLFLLVVISMGNLLAGFLLFKDKFNPYYWELVLGILLSAWIVVQVYMLLAIEALHVIFFFIGILQIILAFAVIHREKLPLPFQAKQN